ncbi:Hypothetical protein, putative [Bodo saltans]|uniref:Uncharacterized protein n=1 Tax=Bodo saltans TaxID=75058 RepID=A0A0S4J8J2_BODSA|nr:Hypothetical protein, putative [Bodo saltans]|eukprot:CUG87816.1 Hypothetical protein, putative [Bodo saltans]
MFCEGAPRMSTAHLSATGLERRRWLLRPHCRAPGVRCTHAHQPSTCIYCPAALPVSPPTAGDIIGVVGHGGLGVMVVKFAKVFGAHVTVYRCWPTVARWKPIGGMQEMWRNNIVRSN